MNALNMQGTYAIVPTPEWGYGQGFAVSRFHDILQTDQPDEIEPLLRRLQEHLDRGMMAVGFLAYEAALTFGLPTQPPLSDFPLCWFGVFHPGDMANWCVETGKAFKNLQSVELKTSFGEYQKNIESIRNHIADGNTYQVNYTVRTQLDARDEIALFQHCLYNQPVPYAAAIHTPEWSVLSLSPELFLQRNENTIVTRPMKGTRNRGRYPDEDERFREELYHSEKDRAENIMIVDMARNDIGRICEFGSVTVPQRFEIETYRTVHQMTGTVQGTLKPDIGLHDILRATFPAASITGAPKHRTMEIIREHETAPRGIYCGAIGFLQSNCRFTFNVAIRTIQRIGSGFQLGLGGGIVWDSKAEAEYQEMCSKSLFVSQSIPDFQLIETIQLDEHGEYLYLDDHMKRLERSCKYWNYLCDIKTIVQELDRYKQGLEAPCVVRLLVDKEGKATVSNRAILKPGRSIKVMISEHAVDSNDPFLFHKTTHRERYNTERDVGLECGCFETIFFNENGCMTEGCITNIFIQIGEQWYTPPVEDGLLAGVWRDRFIQKTNAIVRSLNQNDLKHSRHTVIGNSVIQAIDVDEIVIGGHERFWKQRRNQR